MQLNRQHVLTLGAMVAVVALAGCGTTAPGASGSQFILKERQHTARSAKAAPVVNRTERVISITAPAAHKGSGAIAMNFKLPEDKGYSVLATANDISKLTVTLKTKSFLLTKTVATVDITKAQLVNNRAAVKFTGLEAGNYTVDIVAVDAAGANIGAVTESVAVVANQTATLNSRLQLISTTAPTPAGTGLDLNLEVVNGN